MNTFDLLCRSVESNDVLDDLRPILQDAHLFSFDEEGGVNPPKRADQFSMPYLTTAVCIGDRAAIIFDQTKDDWSEGYECVVAFQSEFAYMPEAQQALTPGDDYPLDGGIQCFVQHGNARLRLDNQGYSLIFRFYEGRSFLIPTTDPDDLIPLPCASLSPASRQAIVNLAQHGAVLVSAINDPEKFVLEASLTKTKDHRPGHILRTHERPLYTVLHPSEIRQRMHLPNPEHDGPAVSPHERRGHFRTFRSERYVHVQGKRKWIDAMWVGPHESTAGKRRYRVVLERLGV